MSTGSCICLTSWFRLWEAMLPTSNCFGILLYEANNLISFAAGCKIDTHHPIAILWSSLLLSWPVGSGQGPRFAGQVQHSQAFHSLPNSYQLILSDRNPGMALTSLWTFAAWSFEQHCPLSLPKLEATNFKQFGQMGAKKQGCQIFRQ